MKTALAAAVLIVLALTGCAGAPEVDQSSQRAAGSSTAAEPDAPIDPAGPVSVTPETATPAAPDEADASYLAEVRIRLQGINGATDAELIAAAHYACDQFELGGTKETIESIAGSSSEEPKPGWNNLVVATWAAMTYCPAFVA